LSDGPGGDQSSALGLRQRSPGVWRLRVYAGPEPGTGQKRSKEFRGSGRQAETERHFAATQLFSNGADVASVSKHLDRSNTSVTLDYYTHVIA